MIMVLFGMRFIRDLDSELIVGTSTDLLLSLPLWRHKNEIKKKT